MTSRSTEKLISNMAGCLKDIQRRLLGAKHAGVSQCETFRFTTPNTATFSKEVQSKCGTGAAEHLPKLFPRFRYTLQKLNSSFLVTMEGL